MLEGQTDYAMAEPKPCEQPAVSLVATLITSVHGLPSAHRREACSLTRDLEAFVQGDVLCMIHSVHPQHSSVDWGSSKWQVFLS